MRNMIKKVIVPALVIVVLFAVLRPLCIQDGNTSCGRLCDSREHHFYGGRYR